MANTLMLRDVVSTIAPLESKGSIIIDNSAWVTGHLGIINQNVNFLKVEACYRLKAGYSVNILKVYY